jgi:hypothetical protein
MKRICLFFLLATKVCLAQDNILQPMDDGCDQFGKFPYKYGANQIILCAKNAGTENGGNPWRWPPGFSVPFCQFSNLGQGKDNCLVDPYALEHCINDAIQEWISCCPAGTIGGYEAVQGLPPECTHCVKITYSNNPQDFYDAGLIPSDVLAFEHDYADANSHKLCTQPIDIIINNTETMHSKKFLVYPCPADRNSCETKNKTHYNLCNTLKHEIGHIFGLQHYEDKFQECPQGNYLADKSIMSSSTNVANICQNAKLSPHDRCYFAGLYCPGNMAVNHFLNHSDSSKLFLYPNPATSSIKIKIGFLSRGKMKLIIKNIFGEVLGITGFNELSVNSEIELNLSNLPSGAYILRYEDDENFSQALFHIIK